jgi:hypothetical protein
MRDFQVGDSVKLSALGIYRKLYNRPVHYRTGHVMGFGQGENTRHCVRVRWTKADQVGDLVHPSFLRHAEVEVVP